MAVSGQAPRYFAIIAEALTKRSVPPALAAAARAAFVGLRTGIATAAGGSSDGGDLAEGLLALLIGASVLRLSGLSDGRFAPAAATTLAGGA